MNDTIRIMSEERTNPPVNPTYECTLGPGYHPNFMARVIIEAKAQDRRFFRVRILTVDNPTFGVQCGKIFTVHQHSLKPIVDWESWKPHQPEEVQVASPS